MASKGQGILTLYSSNESHDAKDYGAVPAVSALLLINWQLGNIRALAVVAFCNIKIDGTCELAVQAIIKPGQMVTPRSH